jgi:uncharacterized protein YjbI with pentapeptide repeats
MTHTSFTLASTRSVEKNMFVTATTTAITTTTTTTTCSSNNTINGINKMFKSTRHSARVITKSLQTQSAAQRRQHLQLNHYPKERERLHEKNEPSTSASATSSSKAVIAAAALAVFLSTTAPWDGAIAGEDDDKKFVRNMLGGCTPDKLDLFKDVRAKFSMEASTGALPEAILDLDQCDYSNLDLDAKVLSGLIARNANFENSQLTHTEMSRTDARGSNFKGVNFKDTNAYSTRFDGSNMENANFENVILSGASFGKYNGEWANMKGANFEGALLSSSDARELCKNPTLDIEGQMNVGGC